MSKSNKLFLLLFAIFFAQTNSIFAPGGHGGSHVGGGGFHGGGVSRVGGGGFHGGGIYHGGSVARGTGYAHVGGITAARTGAVTRPNRTGLNRANVNRAGINRGVNRVGSRAGNKNINRNIAGRNWNRENAWRSWRDGWGWGPGSWWGRGGGGWWARNWPWLALGGIGFWGLGRAWNGWWSQPCYSWTAYGYGYPCTWDHIQLSQPVSLVEAVDTGNWEQPVQQLSTQLSDLKDQVNNLQTKSTEGEQAPQATLDDLQKQITQVEWLIKDVNKMKSTPRVTKAQYEAEMKTKQANPQQRNQPRLGKQQTAEPVEQQVQEPDGWELVY